MSEPAEFTVPNSLDVVRARIFYLACDVEPVSPPAAMLLRAVADAIEDNASAQPIAADLTLNGAASLAGPHLLNVRPVGSARRPVEVVSPQKR